MRFSDKICAPLSIFITLTVSVQGFALPQYSIDKKLNDVKLDNDALQTNMGPDTFNKDELIQEVKSSSGSHSYGGGSSTRSYTPSTTRSYSPSPKNDYSSRSTTRENTISRPYKASSTSSTRSVTPIRHENKTPNIPSARSAETSSKRENNTSARPYKIPETPSAKSEGTTKRENAYRPNINQGGIGGKYKNSELSNVRPLNKDTREGIATNGDRVRFKTDPHGHERITSIVKTDSRTGAVSKIKYDQNGRKTGVQVKRTDGTTIDSRRLKDGSMRVSTVTRSGDRIVSNSRIGYVERSFRNSSNQTIVRRTYVDRVTRRTYVRNYYVDSWGYRAYHPYWSFSVGFYTGFLLSPAWVHPLMCPYYLCPLFPDPWLLNPFNPYADYFAPYSEYYYPAQMITDRIIAQRVSSRNSMLAQQNTDLQNQVDQLNSEIEQMRNNQQSQQSEVQLKAQLQSAETKALIKKELKEQIAGQVNAELAAHAKQSSVPLANVLQDVNYQFIATDEMDFLYTADDGSEQDCTLGAADIFHLAKPVAKGETVAQIKVTTAKKTEDSCPAKKVLSISVKNLEDIKADFAADVDGGAKALHDQQGKNGIPKITDDQAKVLDNYSDADAQEAIKAIDSTESEAAGISADNESSGGPGIEHL